MSSWPNLSLTDRSAPPLQQGESDAKCLFSIRPCQSLPFKLAKVRSWDERRMQAAWLTSWPKNNKHSKDVDIFLQIHRHIKQESVSLGFSYLSNKRQNTIEWRFNGTCEKTLKWRLTSKLYSSTVLLSGSTICQQIRMHKSISSIPPTMINSFWSFMIWKGEKKKHKILVLAQLHTPASVMQLYLCLWSLFTQHLLLTTVIMWFPSHPRTWSPAGFIQTCNHRLITMHLAAINHLLG